jgi:branched-chain amino acid transport system ATP-binding protein
MSFLSVRDVVTAYGKIEALKGVSLEVAEGAITCLLGPNGAGKTTLMMTIAGILKPKRGSIVFAGDDIGGRAPHAIVARGVALVPENRLVFPAMTVLENLHAGAYQRDDRKAVAGDIERMFSRFPRLKERAAQQAGTLSGGEQQMLAVARAMMQDPQLLLLDEPSLGLAPNLVQEIFEKIVYLNRQGTTILLVEQNAFQALKISHRGYVLQLGEIVNAGTGAELAADPKVKEAYLGG